MGNEQPFFAPVAAVVTLGLSFGERGRRALGVVVLQPPDAPFSPDRFFNALAGSGVALAVSHLFPVNPERLVERAAGPIFEELAAALEGVAEALEDGDRDEAEELLGEVRELDERVHDLDEALSAGYETARLSPTRRRSLKHLELYVGASIRMELAVINTRVLVRGAANVLRRGEAVLDSLKEAVFDLARVLATYLEESEGPLQGPGRRLEASTGVCGRQPRRRLRQFVEAGGFRRRLSIEDAKKGNTTHMDLTPGADLQD